MGILRILTLSDVKVTFLFLLISNKCHRETCGTFLLNLVLVVVSGLVGVLGLIQIFLTTLDLVCTSFPATRSSHNGVVLIVNLFLDCLMKPLTGDVDVMKILSFQPNAGSQICAAGLSFWALFVLLLTTLSPFYFIGLGAAFNASVSLKCQPVSSMIAY